MSDSVGQANHRSQRESISIKENGKALVFLTAKRNLLLALMSLFMMKITLFATFVPPYVLARLTGMVQPTV